jgi:hypothetical protein
MVEKMNPQLHAKFKSTYDSFNAQKLSELPSQLFGNAKQLTETSSASATNNTAGAVTQKVSLPQGLQDSYRGLQELIGKANDFTNKAMESATKQLNTVIKKVPPEVTQLFGNTGQFTGQIDGLVKQFANIEQLNEITSKIGIGNLDFNSFVQQNPFNALQSLGASFGNFGSLEQYTSFLKDNPLQAIAQGGPPGSNPIGDSPTPQGGILNKPAGSITQPPPTPATTSTSTPAAVPFSLPNTKEGILQFLPQEITNGLSNINSIPGFGFTGNVPFGLQTALQGIGSNVFGTIASKFAGQLPFLASGILGTAGPGNVPTNYPSNEATKTQAPDGSVKYTTDPTSGTIIKPTPPKPVYTGAAPTT